MIALISCGQSSLESHSKPQLVKGVVMLPPETESFRPDASDSGRLELASELEVFVLVAESGGFANAARRLRLTPSAVSRRIALLEDRLGVELLSRSTRKVELTAVGEAYYQRIKPLLTGIATATHDIARFSPVPVGQLVVTAPAALLERRLVQIVGEYLREAPLARIELVPSELGVTDNCDFVIQSMASSDPDNVSIRLTANPWILCASPAYIANHGQPDHPRDLQEHECLVIATHPHWQFLDGDKELNIVPSSRFISFGSAVYRAAIDGMGIARLAAFLVNDDLRKGLLVRVLDKYIHPADRSLYLIAASNQIEQTKFARFAEFLRSRFVSGF